MKEFYLFSSILIGVVCTYDGYLLYKAQGHVWHVIKNKTVLVTSAVQLLWALFTFYVFFAVDFSIVELMIPVLFAAYNVIGWIYLLKFYSVPKDANIVELVESLDIQIPRWYTVFGLSFGVLFTFSSVWVSFVYS